MGQLARTVVGRNVAKNKTKSPLLWKKEGKESIA
jgi:hypothetical protein